MLLRHRLHFRAFPSILNVFVIFFLVLPNFSFSTQPGSSSSSLAVQASELGREGELGIPPDHSPSSSKLNTLLFPSLVGPQKEVEPVRTPPLENASPLSTVTTLSSAPTSSLWLLATNNPYRFVYYPDIDSTPTATPISTFGSTSYLKSVATPPGFPETAYLLLSPGNGVPSNHKLLKTED